VLPPSARSPRTDPVQLGVKANRVLDILVPEIRLRRSGIVALIDQGDARRVTQYVRVRLEA